MSSSYQKFTLPSKEEGRMLPERDQCIELSVLPLPLAYCNILYKSQVEHGKAAQGKLLVACPTNRAAKKARQTWFAIIYASRWCERNKKGHFLFNAELQIPAMLGM